MPGLSWLSSHLVGLLTGAVLRTLSGAVGAAAADVLGLLGGVMDKTSKPAIGQAWFAVGSPFHTMTAVGIAVTGLFLCACAIQAVLRQDAGLLLRAFFVQLPLAAILTLSALQLSRLADAAVGALCDAFSGGTQVAVVGFATKLTKVILVGTAMGAPGQVFLGFFLGLLVLVGALLLWVEMVVRSLALDAAVLFLPIGLATMVWPAMSHVARRLVETLGAVILSKLVVVVLLSFGAAALGSGTGIADMVTGTGMLLLCTLAPFTVLRLIPVAEFGAIAHLEGVGRSLVTRPMATSWSLGNEVAQLAPTLAAAARPESARAGPVGMREPGAGLETRREPNHTGPLAGLEDWGGYGADVDGG